VEFGLRLPNQLILPIDSKWAATNLLEAFVDSDSLQEQQRIKKQIERAVLHKAREVRKYLHPSLTTSFGVAVVPDAVYDLCTGIQAEAFSLNIVLISYSLFTPYLLMVFQTVLKSGQSVDLQKLEAYLNSVEENLDALQGELEGRYARALRMLTNSGSEMRTQLSQIRGGLSGIQVSARTVTLAEDTPPDTLPEVPAAGRPARSGE
ncbi:MAG: DNA recombination protein RmuC, partial [Anaerolineae bacterium]|nr:DNA recombination protein RmuC [Anaerolineae bacterium]